VVEDQIGLRVGECIEIPVWVGGQQERGVVVNCNSGQLGAPGVVADGVGDRSENEAWKAHGGVALIAYCKCNARSCYVGDVPRAVRPPIETAVKRAVAVIRLSIVASAIHHICVIGDAVGVPAWDRTVVGVVGIYGVESGIIVTKNDIAESSIAISDQEICDAGSIRNEFCCNSRSRQSVFSIGAWWCPRRKDRQRENRKSEKCLHHIETQLKSLVTIAILAPWKLFI